MVIFGSVFVNYGHTYSLFKHNAVIFPAFITLKYSIFNWFNHINDQIYHNHNDNICKCLSNGDSFVFILKSVINF